MSVSQAHAMCLPLQIEKFNPEKMLLTPWLEVFDQLCKYLNIPAEPVGSDGKVLEAPNKRRQLFLLHLDFKVYQKLHFYCLPSKLETKAIPELCTLLQQEYEAPFIRNCNNAVFNSRKQGLKETNRHFIEAVQELGMKASLGDRWSESVAERLLFGARSDKARQQAVALLSGYPKPKPLEKLQIVKQTLLLEDAIEAVMKIPRN
ncbi:Inner kinetochore subunit MCM16 [Frankliniella fusca]|uniref:Inner kinetochore subunit MCM16 n=1 Tax=Frankliniella fusca TaxID=407009 RepID=A0AAE1LVQ1_9NEOP|nr:Inner kinetochore subunit MCM16 [Frankliniella fusca]